MDTISRRSFVKTGAAIGASAFTFIKPGLVRGAGNEKLKIGLVGCGGRGTQAVQDNFTGTENTELVAMGDIFKDRMERSLNSIKNPDPKRFPGGKLPDNLLPEKLASRIKVDPEHQFLGFDAYKKVIDSGVDVVFLAAPPGYRPLHFEACIAANKHVFCEKPFGTDPVGVRRFMDAAKKSEQLKLTVVTGAQRRFSRDYQETIEKIRAGAIGDITAAYAYWIGSPVIQQKARDPQWNEMEWQNRAWYSFVWVCGDQVVEQHLHNIDVCNWFMGGHPEKVAASGGAAWRPREEIYGNIFDHIVADFVYPNGVHMLSHCRQYRQGAYTNVSELLVGAKGRSNCHDLGGGAGQDPRTASRDPLENPYVREHMALVDSIRGKGPSINHAMQVAESTMTCVMARESAYSGLEITWEDMMASKLDLQPEYSWDAKPVVTPLPVPGVYKFEKVAGGSAPRGRKKA